MVGTAEYVVDDRDEMVVFDDGMNVPSSGPRRADFSGAGQEAAGHDA
jgi:hypothetical protein